MDFTSSDALGCRIFSRKFWNVSGIPCSPSAMAAEPHFQGARRDQMCWMSMLTLVQKLTGHCGIVTTRVNLNRRVWTASVFRPRNYDARHYAGGLMDDAPARRVDTHVWEYD